MTPELTRRLLASQAPTSRDVEAALYLSVVRGVALPRALIDRGVIAERRLEAELEQRLGPAAQSVTADPQIVARLPPGICRALCAVPLWTEAGTVVVAAVDPHDGHVESEFRFQLGQPVRLERATVSAIEEALRRLELEGGAPVRRRKRTPAFPHGAPDTVPPSPPPPAGEEDPIPLVRKLAPARLPAIPEYALAATPTPTASAIAEARSGSVSFPSTPPPRLPEDVLELAEAEQAPRSHRPGAETQPLVEPRPEPPPRAPDAGWSPSIPELLSLIRRAAHRDELVELVLRALTLIADRVAVFVVKRDGFQGFACNPAFGSEEELREVLVPQQTPSIFATATAAGYYLGPVPRTRGHAGLLAVMGDASADVAVWVVSVRGKTAMLCVADELDDTMLGTRALGEIATAASDGLERLLVARQG